MAEMITTDGGARERAKAGQVLRDSSVRAQLGFRGSPPREPGEAASINAVTVYNSKYTEAIGVGLPLADAHEVASDSASHYLRSRA